MKNIIYFLFIGILMISCQQNETADNKTTGNAPGTVTTPPTTNTNTKSQAANAKNTSQPVFVIDTYTDEQKNPRSTISLDMHGKQIEVTKAIACTTIERKDYKKYQIPEAAVDACGGWSAGAGDYFYIIKNTSSDYWSIMQAQVEEQQSDAYNYTSIMNIAHTFK